MSDSPFYFAEIIGQEKAKLLLSRALGRRRLAHAFLFKGPAGVGKKTCARSFAARLNCQEPQGIEPCGRCPSCRKFASSNHPDFVFIEADGAAIKIDQIRELKKALAFPPFEAGYRVVLLNEVQTMRREAANSLLKTLEEPPADTILILTADEAGELLPTILSRCQVLPFFPLPLAAVAERLIDTEGLDATEAGTLAAVAEGSLGRARLICRKNLLGLRRELVEALVELPADSLAAIRRIGELAEAVAALKEDLAEFLDLLGTWVYDLILEKQGLGDKVINLDLQVAFPHAHQRWTETEILGLLDRITQAGKKLRRNCNPTAVCEVLFFGLL